MNDPTWNDTLRASLASCVQIPCLPWSSSGDSDTDTGNETRRAGVANPRAAGYVRTQSLDEEDEAADAISLHSQLGGAWNHARRRPPSRRLAFFGLNLFGTRMVNRVELPENGVDPLHRFSTNGNPNLGGGGSADPTRSSIREAGGESIPHTPDAALLADDEAAKRARRRARKELKRQREAVALAQPQLRFDVEFEGVSGGNYDFSSHPHSAPSHPSPHPITPESPRASTPQHEEEDDDADADLDGGAYARLAPRGSAGGSRSSGRSRSSGEGSGSAYTGSGFSGFTVAPRKTKSKRTRAVGSRSSATSSTLASPPPTPSATSFAHAGFSGAGKMPFFAEQEQEFAEEEFDGTPGGLGPDSFDVERLKTVRAEGEEEFDGTQGF